MTGSDTEKSNSGPPFLEFGFRPPLSEISGSTPGTCLRLLFVYDFPIARNLQARTQDYRHLLNFSLLDMMTGLKTTNRFSNCSLKCLRLKLTKSG